MKNYANEEISTFDSLQYYIAEPKGGSFAKADAYLTVVDKEGKMVSHFILKAPAEKCQIDLKASPAEGGTVSGAGEYDCDTRATVKAEANKGYHCTLGRLAGKYRKQGRIIQLHCERNNDTDCSLCKGRRDTFTAWRNGSEHRQRYSS